MVTRVEVCTHPTTGLQFYEFHERLPILGFSYENPWMMVVSSVKSAVQPYVVENAVIGSALVQRLFFSGLQWFKVRAATVDGRELPGARVVDFFRLRSPRILNKLCVAPLADAAHKQLLRALQRVLESSIQ